ncbi:MAG: type IX secretion system sortase PorU [Bacteroidota bacterium]
MQLLSNIKKFFIVLIIGCFVSKSVFSAQIFIKNRIVWHDLKDYKIGKNSYSAFLSFEGATYNYSKYKDLPLFSVSKEIVSGANIRISLKNEVFERIEKSIAFQNTELVKSSNFPDITLTIAYQKTNPTPLAFFLPIRYNVSNGYFEKLVSFEVVIDYTVSNEIPSILAKKSFATNSVLVTGEWFKIGVMKSGVQKIDSNFFKSNKINTVGLDPKSIKIYGNGPGMLPQLNSVDRFDDLQENAIVVVGESDGKLDTKDYILFYGQAQNDQWSYDSLTSRYTHQNNIYSDTTYYFLTFGGTQGKRITQQSATPSPTNQSGEFDYNMVHEIERVNLIKSGRTWLGEEFDKVTQQNFNVSMGNVKLSESMFIRSSTAARSFTISNFYVSVNGNSLLTHTIGTASTDWEYAYAVIDFPRTGTFSASQNVIVSYTYDQPMPGSIGWLDYFELQSRNYLSLNSGQINFRDSRSIGAGKITQFNISSTLPSMRVWELSNKFQPVEMNVTTTSGISSVVSTTDVLKEFIAFDGNTFVKPINFGKVGNQNLHGLSATDYVIVTHPQFINEAKQLAGMYSGTLRTQVVTTTQIYNEFSSGAQDVCAIRDFMRMLYSRALTPTDRPKYLLLFGRASYDYKYRISSNTNYVPTYESVVSFDNSTSYNSDDFYGFLDNNEGTWDSPVDGGSKIDLLDIGIGRLPAQDNLQAQNMVNKIHQYKSISGFGDWRNRMVFVCDDGDGNMHLHQADGFAENARTRFKNYNVEKVYTDAFKQVEEAGGARNPEAQAEITKSVERGALTLNYTGHGGQAGWSHKRILNTDDIRSWTNGVRLPLFITATCQFGPFDDPALTSAGELVLLNPNGGGIGLFTTVRLTDAGSNQTLNTYLYRYLGMDSISVYNRLDLGEIMRRTKNDFISSKNDRNFTLLGDPALMLAYPKYKVATTAINGKAISNVPDTMKAFSKVSVDGIVTDLNGNVMKDFNGVIFPTVFDKCKDYVTLGNDEPASYVEGFKMQLNTIFRGKASVNNGAFHFSYIVPKDISYQNGYGKISYYAQNNTTDANGYYDGFIVGGTADSVGKDTKGPEISLYMNDEKFVNGGTTDENPLFIARLKDETGINIVGTRIGGDMLLTVVNLESTKVYTVNDYYQTKLDTYQEGEVNYRLKKLAQGNNRAKLRAWDVYNNYSESFVDFVVASSAEMALQHVLNYPNPFTTHTTFHFDHNKAGLPLLVSVQIFTISGKLVKTLRTETVSATGHFDQISWDGRDDFGDAIGKGVYVYKVSVRSTIGKTAEQFQKLVILN